MSFRDESDDGKDLRKPFLHTGSWYRMGSRQSSMMGSSQAIRESSISVVACVLIVALGPIQFGFTVSNSFSVNPQLLLYILKQQKLAQLSFFL
jgi:SP family sugar porter-like MFS transporter